MAPWDAISRALGPFDEHDVRSVHDLVPPERVELVGPLETIEVQMMNHGARRRVLVDERESRARHLVIHAVPFADRLHERGLPCPELSRNGDDERRMRRTTEPVSPVAELVLAHGEGAMIGERRQEGRMPRRAWSAW